MKTRHKEVYNLPMKQYQTIESGEVAFELELKQIQITRFEDHGGRKPT